MKKIGRIAVAVLLLAGILTSCGGAPQSPNSSQPIESTAVSDAGDNLDGGVTNATGYPIVNEPVTLKIATWYASGGLEKPADNKTFKSIMEKTGINLEFEMYTDAEKANLLFASRSYPDIAWRLDCNGTQKTDAIEAGDVYSVDEYLDYAPNYKNFLNDNPEIALQCTYKDGKMYSLPYVYLDETSYNLRDQWFINKQWLDELKLKVPTTTSEYLDVLRAFRDNAGKGTIPENVTPHYMRYGEFIGGQFDIYGTFGVYVFGNNYLAMKDGKVVCQAINPDIKEPLKYLQTMYKEGLIKPEAFTDDWAAFAAATSSDPPMVGACTGFQNANLTDTGKWFYPIAPLDAQNGKKPYIRAQVKGSTFPMNYLIFKNNKYPVASVRLANYMAEPEVSMSLEKGVEGIGWKKNAEGKMEINADISVANMEDQDKPLGNAGVLLLTSDMYVDPTRSIEPRRGWAYDHIYKNYIPEVSMNLPNIPSGMLEEMEVTTMSDLELQIKDYIASNLTENGYVLIGYKFVGWNTKEDGSGTAYADKQKIENLTSKDGDKLTFYAQWKLITRHITVVKVWDDRNDRYKFRPDELTVSLIADSGITYEKVTLKDDGNGNWTYTWNSLPVYVNGKEVKYRVTEEGMDGHAYNHKTNAGAVISKDGNT